jgi:hypothetical protein
LRKHSLPKKTLEEKMGGSLVAKRAAVSAPNQTLSLFRLSFCNLLKTFSTSSSSSAAAENPKNETSKPKRRKKKNLFEVAQFLPNWGIGYHMAKSHWANVSYEITKINLYKVLDPPFPFHSYFD